MVIYTDGSCRNNGKANSNGGFGVCGIENDKIVFVYRKDQAPTTNNEMEFKAILYAFLRFGKKEQGDFFQPITVYTDSGYAYNTFTNWMFAWAKNNWKKKDKQTPKNLELVQAYYDRYNEGYRIDLQKVKGHSDNKWNDLADALATGRIRTLEEAREQYEYSTD